MATNKNASIRYNVLDRCFRNPGRKYFMDTLVNACNEALMEFSGISDGIKKRQVFEDIKFMESEQGWSIPLERHKDGKRIFYRYSDLNFSISNQPINENEASQLKETLLMLSRFKGMPHFEWIEELAIRLESSFSLKGNTVKVIDFEQNPYLKGIEYFSVFFNSIVYKIPLLIKYKGFKQENAVDIVCHPYYLKQYNNRWFAFCRNQERGTITNFALDRVNKASECNVPFIENELIDFETYFDDCIGVTIPTDARPEKVLLQIDSELWPYIETKPLHGSQKIIAKASNHITVELFVYVNFELTSLLFSFGPQLKVLAPIGLLEKIKAKAISTVEKYS